MNDKELDVAIRTEKIIAILKHATDGMVELASSALVTCFGRKPFIVLVGCILSLRTKDTVSLPASIRLFECAKTPQELLRRCLATGLPQLIERSLQDRLFRVF